MLPFSASTVICWYIGRYCIIMVNQISNSIIFNLLQVQAADLTLLVIVLWYLMKTPVPVDVPERRQQLSQL